MRTTAVLRLRGKVEPSAERFPSHDGPGNGDWLRTSSDRARRPLPAPLLPSAGGEASAERALCLENGRGLAQALPSRTIVEFRERGSPVPVPGPPCGFVRFDLGLRVSSIPRRFPWRDMEDFAWTHPNDGRTWRSGS